MQPSEPAVGERRLFVYWHVAHEHAALAQSALRTVQRRCQALHPGLHCSVLQRERSAAADTTLMETYARAGGVDATLQASIDALADAATSHWRLGSRHVEVFVGCAD